MFSNRYVQRRVASADSRPCFLCYKPTTAVMVHENDADFFYACDTHLKDPGFAVLDSAGRDAERKKRERDLQIEQLKKEWQEKSKQKSEETQAKNEDKSEDKNEDKSEKKTDRAVKDSVSGPPDLPPLAPVRKVYELNKGIMSLRFNAKRRAAQERRTKTLLETPGAFPKVPSHKPK